MTRGRTNADPSILSDLTWQFASDTRLKPTDSAAVRNDKIAFANQTITSVADTNALAQTLVNNLGAPSVLRVINDIQADFSNVLSTMGIGPDLTHSVFINHLHEYVLRITLS